MLIGCTLTDCFISYCHYLVKDFMKLHSQGRLEKKKVYITAEQRNINK